MRRDVRNAVRSGGKTIIRRGPTSLTRELVTVHQRHQNESKKEDNTSDQIEKPTNEENK